MTSMNDFNRTDIFDDVMAEDVNKLMAASLRSEYANSETLSADRQLLDADTPYQRLNANGADRKVLLPEPDAVNNHPFVIVNDTGATYDLNVRDYGDTETLITLADGEKAFFLPDGNGSYFEIHTTNILDAYPVGAVYISVNNTDPGTLFGGTWAAFGSGRMLVGYDSGDTDFDAAEETGGAKTHTLVEAELPAHTHPRGTRYYSGSANGTSGRISGQAVGGAGVTNDTDSGNTGSTGGGGAHNNMPPYIVVYMWKRTA